MSTPNTINTRIQLKRDTESEWVSHNPQLLDGEVALVECTDGRLRAKIGDGQTAYGSLGFVDHIHIVTEENEEDAYPANAILIIDTTEEDLTGNFVGGGSTGGSGTGSDGFSPTIAITAITGGHTVTITDKNGPHPFNVMDGKDGTTPLKGTHYWTAADKTEIVNEVLAALPNGNGVTY